MSKTLQGHRTKLNETKRTEAPTVSSHGETTVKLCSNKDRLLAHLCLVSKENLSTLLKYTFYIDLTYSCKAQEQQVSANLEKNKNITNAIKSWPATMVSWEGSSCPAPGGGHLRRTECGNIISGANCIVFHSNYGPILLSFWDIDGRIDVGDLCP